jgi:hypothetical protein
MKAAMSAAQKNDGRDALPPVCAGKIMPPMEIHPILHPIRSLKEVSVHVGIVTIGTVIACPQRRSASAGRRSASTYPRQSPRVQNFHGQC